MFEPFRERARAKINLALHVLGRRADGYHELDSIVAFADVGDELTFSPAPEFAITASGPFASALPPASDNIIAKAWHSVADIAECRGVKLPRLTVHLTKNLPVASGIGGGSANAAAAIRGFLRAAGIHALDAEIMTAALALGADVPVCLAGRACRMRGVGERMTPLTDFRPLHALLVNPGVAVPTPAVFRQLGLATGQEFGRPIEDFENPATWRNDLMAPAAALAPVIDEVIAVLKSRSEITTVGMSGSGATCFGLSGAAVACPPRDGWWSVSTMLS
jgi:4-diphosphocytidyl-2-C-methyl-D-erythritol kinase